MVCVRGGDCDTGGAEVGRADELGEPALDELGSGLAVTGDPPDVQAAAAMMPVSTMSVPTTAARGLGRLCTAPTFLPAPDSSVRYMELTHVDPSGAARMVDVSGKEVTTRSARAAGRLRTTAEVIELLRTNSLAKGDALAVARIAGIAAAKRTADLIPLCHPLGLHAVEVELELGPDYVDLVATTRTADRTGVEMEALTAVSVAGLALYDMMKAVDRAAVLGDVRLLAKSGGRSGTWIRDVATVSE
jgi:cyclic pyranopterin phosphate synthase